MKKFLLVLLFLLILFGGYILYDNYANKGIPKLKTEEEIIDIDNLIIYGNHLNLNGNLVDDKNLDLILYNGEFLEYSINEVSGKFNLSDNINEGINLEKIPIGKYYMFLRSTNKDENDKEIYKYYILNNTTKYKETTYYTFRNVNNKINITTDDEYNTIMLDVIQNNDEDIYDIVIDPGHGGIDSGANKNGYREADVTMQLALNLKEKMENYGIKVKLTRESDQLSKNETLKDYGVHGRAVIPHEVHAKYLFSIHMNSNESAYVKGLEVYAPAYINYDFAKKLATNLVNNTGSTYSSNKINKKYDGVYNRMFTESNIASSKQEYINKGMTPYDVTTNSNYYYMIRETGGIMTGAYVDGRNKEIEANPYFDSNVGTEAYLLELGYLSSRSDLNNVINNIDKYTQTIADTFKTIYTND